MKLVDMKVSEYLEVLKSNAPAPGGGSASALAAAQGISLVAMVADLTIGREKYAEYEKVCIEARDEALELYGKLSAAVDKDTEAFNLVSDAFKLPKGSDEEKVARSKAIAEATLTATEVPFETLMLCAEGLKIAEKIVGKSNPNAASDLGVAALNLLTGLKGAWLNVLINLPGVKDEAKKEEFMTGRKRIIEGEATAARIYAEVSAML